jgi:phosphatidylglycerol:prolipoprotein diacylglycerol transferase
LNWLFKRQKYTGQIFFHGLTLYAVLRFVIEIYRGDDYRGYVFNGALSYSQLVSIVILAFSTTAMFLYSRLKEK